MLKPKGSERKMDGSDRVLRKFFRQRNGLPIAGKKVSGHPDIVTLSDYINQSLRGPEMKNIEMHLASCPKCQKAVESASDAVRRFNSSDLENVPNNASFDIASHLKKLHIKDSGNPPKK